MPRAERTITIDRPLDEVFGFFADAENDVKWRRGVREIERDGPLHAGARYRQLVSGPGGRPIPADIEVTGYEPTSLVSFRVVAGPVRPEGSYRFRATDAGAEVTFTLSCELSGMKKLVMNRPAQRSMDAEMADLVVAKKVLEG
jgi:Predicted integral membrane protein